MESISETSEAKQVRCAGGFELPCGADEAFPLFSPEGERDWIKTWNPRAVFPGTIEFCRDTVFREGTVSEEAVWTIVDVDWSSHRAEYVRIAASHAAHIVVKIEAGGVDCCRVAVSYTITTLDAGAEHLLEAFSETAYATRMNNWERQIGEFLAGRESASR